MAANHQYRTRSKPAQTTLNQGASTARDNLDSSSDYSDWLSQSAHQLTFSPPKQKKRRKRRPTNKNTKLKVEQSTEQRSPHKDNSKWFTEVIPWKMPYFPQMGDDVVYFLQGHQIYLDTIKEKYIASTNEPWAKLNLKEQEFCKIVGIKYETHSLPVCCLKLSLTDQEGHLTGESFSIKYHPKKEIMDFLILRQVYNKSIEKAWIIGTRFRHLNADHVWSFGTIQAMEPFQDKFPKSIFRCYRVRWDNDGVVDTLSPWDLEPIDDSGTSLIDKGMAAQPKDIRKFLFQPQRQDWPMGDRGVACRKLLHALNEVMQLPIAGDFIDPVQSPEVEYPVNLAIIKARLENRFYRYIASVKFDIRYLAKNAERSNPRHSVAVKYARILVDMCLEIIKNLHQENVIVIDYYHRFLADFTWSDSNMEVDEVEACRVSPTNPKSPVKHFSMVNLPAEQTPSASTSRSDNNNLQEQPSTSAHRSNISPQKTPKKCAQSATDEWKDQCRQVLKILWDSEDAISFRQPVDPLSFPDYEVMVSTPMCLHYIDENLEVDNYRDPKQIYDDLRLVISNSRKYNNNRKSEVYIKTTRLSHMIDDLMKPILRSYTSTRTKSPRNRYVAEDEIEEISSDCFDDINNDPTWTLSSQNLTQDSEAFSQVMNKLSQELDDAKLQNDVSNVPINNAVQVREAEARNDNDNRAVVINVNDNNLSENEDTDTGFEDHSNCQSSDSWDEALKAQVCLNEHCYHQK